MEGDDEYLAGFLDGFEFLLLALEGRMDLLDEAAAEELAPFIEDYRRLGELLRERGICPRPRGKRAGVAPVGGPRFKVMDLEPAMRN